MVMRYSVLTPASDFPKETKLKIRAAIVSLNDLYGRGKVFNINYATGEVEFRIYATQRTFGNPEYAKFRFNPHNNTVYFRRHQRKIK